MKPKALTLRALGNTAQSRPAHGVDGAALLYPFDDDGADPEPGADLAEPPYDAATVVGAWHRKLKAIRDDAGRTRRTRATRGRAPTAAPRRPATTTTTTTGRRAALRGQQRVMEALKTLRRLCFWLAATSAYRPPLRYFASCCRGLEEVLASELSGPRIRSPEVRVGKSGCEFDGDMGVLLRAGLERARRPSVDTTLGRAPSAALTHSHFSSLTVKNAIVDSFAGNRLGAGRRRHKACGVPVHLYVDYDEARLYRAVASESLHKRGYRGDVAHKAALRTTVAAGLLYLADWPAKAAAGAVLCDPMCGSGTLPVEAALMARDVAPGLIRAGFGPSEAPSAACDLARPTATPGARPSARPSAAPCPARRRRSLRATRTTARSASPGRRAARPSTAASSCGDAATLAGRDTDVVVSNPPWDGRLDGAEEAWDALGSFLRREAPGATAHALTGNMAVTRNLRMRASSKRKLVSGGVDLRFLKYEVRGGTPKTEAAPAEAEADAPAEPEAKPAAKPAGADGRVLAATPRAQKPPYFGAYFAGSARKASRFASEPKRQT
ncbi:hypothetical protein JL721_5694 [Aureococcus anophagefferens]|nr:hypothetical protein JL721_5694 [Aureococcus anophagefferens]